MLFELYRKHLESRLLAPSTIRHQVTMLTVFFRWLETRQSGTDKDVRDVILQDLIDYHEHLQSRRKPQGGEISIAHRCTQMWIIKRFFRFLYERKKILIDPGARFPILRTPQAMPKGVLSNEQVLRLLAQPNLASPLGYRDRAMLELLYSSGLRGLELVRLTIYDVDFKDGTVRVLQGKWSRDRIVPLGQTAAKYLREYMSQVRPILLTKPAGKSAVSQLFLNNYGGPLNSHVLRRIVRRLAKTAGLPHNTAAHGLRHACATEMLKGGANVRHVQELLGHENLTTTQIYTRVVPVDLQKVHTATSPSERRRNLNVPEFKCYRLRDRKNKVALTKAPRTH